MTDRVQVSGTWGEVVVGSQVLDRNGQAWEVEAMRNGYRLLAAIGVPNQKVSMPPCPDNATVTLLLDADQAAVLLLVRDLGATVLATWDSATGETTCPAYADEDLLEHMRFAHGINTGALPGLGLRRYQAAADLHARAHTPEERAVINRGGFPHTHVS